MKSSSTKIRSTKQQEITFQRITSLSTKNQKSSTSQVFSDSSLRTSMTWILEGSRLFSMDKSFSSSITENYSICSETKRKLFRNVSWRKWSSFLQGITPSSSSIKKQMKERNWTSRLRTMRKSMKSSSS